MNVVIRGSIRDWERCERLNCNEGLIVCERACYVQTNETSLVRY